MVCLPCMLYPCIIVIAGEYDWGLSIIPTSFLPIHPYIDKYMVEPLRFWSGGRGGERYRKKAKKQKTSMNPNPNINIVFMLCLY